MKACFIHHGWGDSVVSAKISGPEYFMLIIVQLVFGAKKGRCSRLFVGHGNFIGPGIEGITKQVGHTDKCGFCNSYGCECFPLGLLPKTDRQAGRQTQ